MSRAGLEGAKVWVTGAGSGIGRGAALACAAEGAEVVCLGRRLEPLAETREMLAGTAGGAGSALSLDVGSPAAVEAVLPAALAEHGTPAAWVNAAGITVVGALDELAEADWDRQLDVNLKSIWALTRVIWEPLRRRGGGAIVNVASTASLAAFPHDAAYVASKGGVLALTKAMALDGAPHGIRVNAVCPGYIDTPNLRGYFASQDDPAAAASAAASAAPLARMGTPADVGAAIAFLASEDAAFVTGASLLVDGGVLAKVPTG